MVIYRPEGIRLLDVEVSDSSYHYQAIGVVESITLYFSLAEYVDIPVGSYCSFGGVTYTLERPESLVMHHTREFEYTIEMFSSAWKSKIWKFRNPVDGRLKFSLTAKPSEHLQMFVDNMNLRDNYWEVGVGECIDGEEVTINYDHDYCFDALAKIADACNTEFDFNGYVVSLRKIEHNKSNPLPLSYGRGNGFKSGVGRSNYGDTPPVDVLFVQGGDRNIDMSKYHSSELHLPINGTISYDGEHFEDEVGFNQSNARTYVADAQGMYIRRQLRNYSSNVEDSLDCTTVYPKRIGEVTSVVVVDANRHEYDIIDSTIPSNLDYSDCLIAGEKMTIIFQSGQLAGREFEVAYKHDTRRFEIVPQEIDGQTMPNAQFLPAVGDKYAVFHCMLPQSYINTYTSSGEPKQGAEWDMMRQSVKYLYEHEQETFTFSGQLDGIWAKKNWQNVGSSLVVGGYIMFTDERFAVEGVLVRIVGMKTYINKMYSPELELSNSIVSGSFGTRINQIESKEVLMDEYHEDSLQFTRRRFRDAEQTMMMLNDALFENFENSINPLTVRTMMMLIGDESLQFQFLSALSGGTVITPNISYNQQTKVLSCPVSYIQHMTLGIDTVASQHTANEYTYWQISQYISSPLDDPSKHYYLYAVCSETQGGISNVGTATYLLSETARPLHSNNEYNLLIGVINSEYEGERSIAFLYGFTEILPGRITVDKIVSTNGSTYFDLANNEIGGNIKFKSTEGTLMNVAALENIVNSTTITANNAYALAGSKNHVYVTPSFTGATVTNYKQGDLWVALDTYKMRACNSTAQSENTYNAGDWSNIGYTDDTAANAAQAILNNMASDSKVTPAEKIQLKTEMLNITADYTELHTKANAVGVTHTAYTTAYNTLNTYVSNILSNMSTTTNINGTTYNNDFTAYYTQRAIVISAISGKQAQDAVDDLDVGQGNYIKNGAFFTDFSGWWYWGVSNHDIYQDATMGNCMRFEKTDNTQISVVNTRWVSQNGNIALPDNKFNEGTEYTLAFWAKAGSNIQLSVGFMDTSGLYPVLAYRAFNVTNEWNRIEVTFTANNRSSSDTQLFIKCEAATTYQWLMFTKFVLVEGNKAPEWTVSAAEFQAQISATAQTLAAITNNYTQIDGGLILSTYLKLGALLSNGVYTESAGVKAMLQNVNEVAAYFGGTLAEAIAGTKSGMCIIYHDGKLKASNAEIEGKVTASDGQIGGFTIGSDSITGGLGKKLILGAAPMSVEFQAKVDSKVVTVNGSPHTYVPYSYSFTYYENRKTTIANSSPSSVNWTNISVVDVLNIDYFSTTSAGNPEGRYYGYQYAMLGNGHICLDGIVEGNALDVMDVFTANNQIHMIALPLNSNRIAIQSSYDNDILILPDILSLMSTIGVGIVSENNKKCSFRIDIMNVGSKTVYIAGYNNANVSNAYPFQRDEFPRVYQNGVLKTGARDIRLGSNRHMSIMLVYTGSAYRAYIET